MKIMCKHCRAVQRLMRRAKRVHSQTNPCRRSAPLEPETIDNVLAAIEKSCNHQVYLAAVLSSDTGMRFREIADLPWSAVDFEKKLIRVLQKKTGEVRIVPMSDAVIAALTNAAEQKCGDRVFCHGHESLKSSLRRALESCCKRLRIAWYRFTLFVRALLRNCVPPGSAQTCSAA